MNTRNVLPFFVFAMFLIVAQGATAVVVERIEVTNCSFSSSDALTCGNTNTVACQVVDTFLGSPSPVIVAVRMQVGTTFAEATLTSGTTRNGTWTATVDPETYAVNGALAINRVLAMDSANNVGPNGCDFSPNGASGFNYEAAECIGSTGTATVSADCSCSYTTETSCSPSNVLTTTKYASAGCTGAAATTTETRGYCDYCDPGWVATVGECTISKEYNVTDKFVGVAQKQYLAANQECVDLAQSGLGDPNDADPPADDGALVLCRLDAWSAGGADAQGSNRHPGSTSIRTQASARDEFNVYDAVGVDDAGRVLRPLVFDVNQDGIQEFVIFDEAGVTVKNFDGEVVSDALGGMQWEGQPSLWGYNYAGAQLWSSALRTGSAGAGVAGIYYNSSDGKDYFVAMKFAVGSGVISTRVLKIDDVVGSTAYGSGVSCADTYCWFVTNNMKGTIVDLSGVSLTSVTYDPLSPGAVLETSMSSTPALINVGANLSNPNFTTARPQVVAWIGKSTTPKFAWFACTTTGVCDVEELSYSGNLLNASNIVVGKVIPPTTTPGTAYVDLYFTYNKNASGTTASVMNTIRLNANFVDAAGLPSSLTFGSAFEKTLAGVAGGAAECVSEPAAAKCANGQQGVAMLSSWVPATVTATTTWTLPAKVETSASAVTIPLTGVNADSPSALNVVECGNSICYALSGATRTTSTAKGDYSLYRSVNGGAYVNVPLNDIIRNIYATGATSCGGYTGYGTRIAGTGMIGDDYYVLTSDPVSVTACPWTINIKLWKLSGITWTLVKDFGNITSNFGGYNSIIGTANSLVPDEYTPVQQNGVPFSMRCDSGYCSWPIGRNPNTYSQGYGWLRVDVSTGTYTTKYLKGSYFGGNLNATRPYEYIRTTTNDDVFAVSGAVIFYNSAAPNTPVVLDQSTDLASRFVGLAQGPDNRVYWTKIPRTTAITSSNTLCTVNTSVTPAQAQEYFWKALGIGEFKLPRATGYTSSGGGYGYNNPLPVQILKCGVTVSNYVINGAVAQAANDTWYIPYKYGVNHAISSLSNGNTGQSALFSRANAYSEGGFDYSGKYYAEYPLSLGSYITGSGGNVMVVSYKDGGELKTYMAHGTERSYTTAGLAGPTVGNNVCEVGPGGGYVMSISGPFYTSPYNWYFTYNYTGATSGTDCFPTPVNAGATGSAGYFNKNDAAVVRAFDTSTGQVRVDYFGGTNRSTVGSPYNQLDCYSATGSAVAKDSSKQLGSYYCTKQISTAEVNADGKDELLTPQGLFSIGGSSVAKITLGGVTSTSSSATAIVDVNGDTFADAYQVTATGIHGLMSRASNVGFSQTGIVGSAEVYCRTAQVRDYECESYGGSQADCTETELYYAPQLLGSIDPSNVVWTAKVYKNGLPGTGADSVLAQNLLNGEEKYGLVIDALVKFLKLDAVYAVYRPLAYAISSTDSLVQDATYGADSYGSYVVTSPGTYVVNVAAVDQTTGQTFTGAQCIVGNVTLPAGQTTTGSTVAELSCSLGEKNIDGEFNYDGASLDSHGWVVRQVGNAPYVVKDGKLQVTPATSGSLQITHGMTCDDKKGLVQVKLRMNSLSEGSAQFSVYGTMVETGAKVPVSLFTVGVNSNRVLTIDAYGKDDVQQVYRGNVNTSQELVLNIEIDRFAKTVRTGLNGSVADAVTTTLLNDAYGQFSGVSFTSNGPASVYLDYIRFGVSGVEYVPVSVNQTQTQNAYAALDDCVTLSERLELLGSTQGYHPDMNANLSQSAPNIVEFCGLHPGSNGGQCLSFAQLTDAVSYNAKCYDEAYQYCLAVTYPDELNVEGMKSKQTGLDGATVCAAELTVTAGVNKIAAPTAGLVWRLFISNWKLWLLLVGLIALVSVARSRTR